ncbi:ABC transporter substrate-binding protein [Kitasatospora sp. MMS16-BH015]|uniref:ABC transporter substrate-binding protein n=1 Tax=Kitasatospora sp. MMS16-BH015 TaxID=2018025 RepID=UPI000CA2AF23|nr:ABC transporter substrate-binding protein [Kitasatospora sp. MMS16-BH015]AUG75489.1 ABC transporter substrate-binding protein [Kitasatospora sp. MMS16-BH015]
MTPHPDQLRPRSPLARTLATATALLAATALLTGCGSSGGSGSSGSAGGSGSPSAAAASFPATVTAANGAVTLKSQPQHIVSLSPTATEDLYAVGAGKQVVAVDSSSNYPTGVPTSTLSGLTPNIEAIVVYHPDLVIASQDTNGLVAGLTKLGVPVMIEPAAAKLDDAYQQIERIGQATGHSAEASKTVTDMKTKIADTVKQAGSGHTDQSYFWEVSANPYYSATSTTFVGQVASLFGLKNIADAAAKTADGGYPQLAQEYIVSAQPQLIFLTDSGAASGGQTAQVVAARPGWNTVPAVKNNRIVALNEDIASRWGPRLPELVTAIAQAVQKAPAQ